jgi:hydrogenase large subunit
MLVGYASGREEFQEIVNGTLAALDVPVDALFSTLGRTAARAMETKLMTEWAFEFYDSLIGNIRNGDQKMANMDMWKAELWPAEASGVGLSEAPRGALAHWIVIKDKMVDNYQLVVPSTWNASPRDPSGQRSSYEASLLDTPVHDPDQPLEVIRTIHSFDPCLACAIHLYDEKGEHVHQVKVS